MRVALVAGPDPGHAFPAIALALRLAGAGDDVLVLTGAQWTSRLADIGLEAEEIPDLAAAPEDPDVDLGRRLHARAADMAPALAEQLEDWAPDLVVADVLTAVGGLAAELLGIPWAQLHPHPLYLPSAYLPPPGAGLAPGRGPMGRSRDVLLRRAHRRSWRAGLAQRAEARATLDLPARDRGPQVHLVATLPALEPARPDWPSNASVVGTLSWDPAEDDLAPPPGHSPLVLLSASTAAGGQSGLLEAALAGLTDVRLASTVLAPAEGEPTPPERELPDWARVGVGRQEPLLAKARVVISGGGHGMLAKSLAAGIPLVLAPASGDQWELARRVERLGAAVVVKRAGPRQLARAVDRILENASYSVAAGHIARGAVTADPVVLCHLAVQSAHGRLSASSGQLPEQRRHAESDQLP